MLVGLTGRSGSGKSTVSKVFLENGFFVIDADKVSKSVSASDKGILAIKTAFGDGVFEDGVLNRRKLAAIVFSDKKELEKLNKSLLPLICDEIDGIILNNKQNYVLLDAPTLFESGINTRCDKIIAVVAPNETLISRIMERDFLTKDEAEKRLNSQHNDTFFKENADIVITNDKDLETLKESALKALKTLKES